MPEETVKILISERNKLPDTPGVYLFFDASGTLMYVGKATSLKSRVGSYFHSSKSFERAIDEVVKDIEYIEYIETPTVLEAFITEANLIRKHKPPYNVLLKDDKSFLWICFTKDEYPRVVLVRGKDLEDLGDRVDKVYPKRWGPFVGAKFVRLALEILRKIFPWSDCYPDQVRPCFNAQIGRCAGVCTRAMTPQAYKQILRRMAMFLDGERATLEKQMLRDMEAAAREEHFEEAAELRNQLFALQHIQDMALINSREEEAPPTNLAVNPFKRIEGYDISHLSGTGMVASMVVFNHGEPDKSQYRKFEIKGFTKSNDTGALKETINRRLNHSEWPLPEVFFIDGGEGQVNAVMKVLKERGVNVPVVGIAKGALRKNIRYVFDRRNVALDRAIRLYGHIFVKVRNEAHRFAITYQRKKRNMRDFSG